MFRTGKKLTFGHKTCTHVASVIQLFDDIVRSCLGEVQVGKLESYKSFGRILMNSGHIDFIYMSDVCFR